MTRERISKLSDKDLVKLAELFSLDPFDEYNLDEDSLEPIPQESRRELEEQIFDVMEESRQEQQESDSHPVNYQQKHFQSIEEIFGHPFDDENSFFTFPEQYNVTRIMLMLRDPEWAYSYWDISNQDRARLTGRSDFKYFCIVLREHESSIAEDRPAGETVEGSSVGPSPQAEASANRVEMKIPVQMSDSSWYINIPRRNRYYSVELVAELNEGHESLARSGMIFVPGGNFSRNLENINSQESEVLIALSGIEDLGVSAFEGSPRRLVEIIEQDEQ